MPRWKSGRAGQGEWRKDDGIRQIVLGWFVVTGPVTSQVLAARLGVRQADIEIALAALEGMGTVLRGRFTPGTVEEEWCERRLLARIHRLTLGRLRREIEAVPAADFMRFLFRWQHIQPGSQLHGRDGVLQIIGQLQGMELPAPAWEEYVIPERVRLYDPADLEHLCLSGTVTWGRLSAGAALNREPVQGAAMTEEPSGAGKRRQGPGRNSPIAFVLREDLPVFLGDQRDLDAALARLSSAAGAVARYLQQRGASFMPDIVKVTRGLPAEVEDALWELVVHDAVIVDVYVGLERLLHGGGRHRA